jgi:DNA-binding NarL/FixJ family response regulator
MKTYGNIKVAIADDHEIFRDGLRVMLQKQPDILLVAEAANGKELIEQVQAQSPDIVISDVKMPVMDGAAATRHLTENYPQVGIIALTMFDEEDLIIDMLEAGAKGYLLKNADKNEIVEAIKSVYQQQPYYCRHTSNKLAQMVAKSKFNPYKHKQKPEFNEREIDIIGDICNGLTSKQIAEKIFLSVRTVEGLRLKIMEKMEVKNTAGIIIYAIKNNLYKPGNV